MDPVDSSNPDTDFVALYTRQNGDEIQIRLDLLDLQQDPTFDLILAIDTQPGGNPPLLKRNIDSSIGWEILIETDSSNKVELHTSSATLTDRLRVLRNPTEDTLIISFSSHAFQSNIPSQVSIAAWIFPLGEIGPVDSIGPVKFFATSPKQAPVVLYFWNLFEGASPAQALRRWDGAHSGPDSARHGLAHLLDAVEESQLPVFLSDLNTPQNLSALDYLGVLDRIRQLARADLISMSDVSIINLSNQPTFSVPDMVYEKGVAWTSQVSQQFSMPDTQVLVAQQWPSTLRFSERYKIVFPTQLSPIFTAKICSYGQVRVLCNTEPIDLQEALDPYNQVTEHGLTLNVKKELVNAAFLEDGSILFLGGDFGLSTWGIRGYSMSALEYIRSHPWIRVLSLGDLQEWNTKPGLDQLTLPKVPDVYVPFVPETVDGIPIPSGLSTEEINANVLDALSSLPDGPLTSGIWQWYFELLSARSSKHHLLNAATLGQLGHLIAGAQWVNNPYTLTDCELDLDWDGENECVLSSEHLFASLEPAGGTIVIGLLLTQEGVQQFIAPTYQVYSGISDPFLWHPEKGFAGDPDAVQGAPIERANVGLRYQVNFAEDGVVELGYGNMPMRKIFSLTSASLDVDYLTSGTTIVSGMLVNNPWERFYPLWATTSSRSSIHLTTNAELTNNLFTSSQEYLRLPEDPNFDYTAGHHQLFPFDSFTIVGRDEFRIRFEWPR